MKVLTLSVLGILIISLIAVCNGSCPVKYQGIEGHTACISRSPDYVSGGVTEAQAKEIVDMHNKHRAEVNPPACMMLKMYWNDDLAHVAQKWAENCVFDHDASLKRRIPGSFAAGQNMAKGQKTWAETISSWHSEVKDFTYGAKPTGVVGHYTQMVWGTSGLIGCGYAQCKDFTLFVCNYAPSGNAKGKEWLPYEKCANPTPLKDCQGKMCKNGGKFEADSCTCKCKASPQISGPVCDIDCDINDRKTPCTQFPASYCGKYVNVPDECPWLCNICPFINQKDPETTTTEPPSETTITPTTNPTTTNPTTTNPTTTKSGEKTTIKPTGKPTTTKPTTKLLTTIKPTMTKRRTTKPTTTKPTTTKPTTTKPTTTKPTTTKPTTTEPTATKPTTTKPTTTKPTTTKSTTTKPMTTKPTTTKSTTTKPTTTKPTTTKPTTTKPTTTKPTTTEPTTTKPTTTKPRTTKPTTTKPTTTNPGTTKPTTTKPKTTKPTTTKPTVPPSGSSKFSATYPLVLTVIFLVLMM